LYKYLFLVFIKEYIYNIYNKYIKKKKKKKKGKLYYYICYIIIFTYERGIDYFYRSHINIFVKIY